LPLRRIWLIRAHIQNCPYPFAIMLPIPVFIHTRMGYPTGILYSCNSAVCTHTRSTRRRPHPESLIFTRSTSSGHPPNGSAAALPVLPALLHLLVLISSTKSIRPLHHGECWTFAECWNSAKIECTVCRNFAECLGLGTRQRVCLPSARSIALGKYSSTRQTTGFRYR